MFLFTKWGEKGNENKEWMECGELLVFVFFLQNSLDSKGEHNNIPYVY